MRARHRVIGRANFIALLLASFLFAGCFNEPRELSIPPRTDPQSQSEVGLGPGVRPLSSGPGVKGSPSWSPSGERIAFTVDGYVVDKAPDDQDFERRTTKDFKALTVTWMSSGNSLAILGADSRSAPGTPSSSGPLAFYETSPKEGSLEVNRISPGAKIMASGPAGEWVLLAVEEGAESRLTLAEAGGNVQPLAAAVEGEVTGMSVSPAGDMAVLAVRDATSNRFEIHAYSFPGSDLQRIARLEEGMEIIGDPQWTKNGIYYAAGEEESLERDAAPFDLYRVPSGSTTPELAPGIGDDFVTSNLKRDPKGERLAVIGRRNPSSSENLYILDLASENLEAVTSNEDMQIKTATADLAWSFDGSSVVIVARAVLSKPKVYSAPVGTLVTDFYNLYEVAIESPTGSVAE